MSKTASKKSRPGEKQASSLLREPAGGQLRTVGWPRRIVFLAAHRGASGGGGGGGLGELEKENEA